VVPSQVQGGMMGWGAKNHETERDGSISGVPCELVARGDRGRW
jgi:hypothetical protein